ncbi:MAG: hypothetical protein HY059_18690 [Proteobacteria bacterium]|nr:hypothetical protein [Pseudomonadota bacterium]
MAIRYPVVDTMLRRSTLLLQALAAALVLAAPRAADSQDWTHADVWIDPTAFASCGGGDVPAPIFETMSAPRRPASVRRLKSALLHPTIDKEEKAPVTRFTRLAGKFMGTVDAASVGAFRLRFEVILK